MLMWVVWQTVILHCPHSISFIHIRLLIGPLNEHFSPNFQGPLWTFYHQSTYMIVAMWKTKIHLVFHSAILSSILLFLEILFCSLFNFLCSAWEVWQIVCAKLVLHQLKFACLLIIVMLQHLFFIVITWYLE